jgi:phosphopantothenoylcysteine decarboxylase / phosphopantothenate---cysteine ligase
LHQSGVRIIPAEEGELASGLIGEGRLAEPEHIVKYLQDYFDLNQRFVGETVLITAGPTHEKIDPVRFIGNNSSGKMGYRIAETFLKQGASVILISGPSNEKLTHPHLNLIKVESALEMLSQVEKHWTKASIGVFAAAVADYRPLNKAEEKIKKKEDSLTIELIKNPDILAWAGSQKTSNQFLVGFALETNNELENAKKNLQRKNLDLIVLNSLNNKGAGFQHETNQIQIIDKHNKMISFELKNKKKWLLI